jgi:hypothetical protein
MVSVSATPVEPGSMGDRVDQSRDGAANAITLHSRGTADTPAQLAHAHARTLTHSHTQSSTHVHTNTKLDNTVRQTRSQSTQPHTKSLIPVPTQYTPSRSVAPGTRIKVSLVKNSKGGKSHIFDRSRDLEVSARTTVRTTITTAARPIAVR